VLYITSVILFYNIGVYLNIAVNYRGICFIILASGADTFNLSKNEFTHCSCKLGPFVIAEKIVVLKWTRLQKRVSELAPKFVCNIGISLRKPFNDISIF
jgi:hypothetical protein